VAARGTSESSAIEAATRRLAAALDSLEAALERRAQADGRETSLAAQVSALGADRSRLGAELDQQTARAQKLGTASREVAERLDAAMETVRAVVDAHGGA
jgi:chromosome segregation ATPase